MPPVSQKQRAAMYAAKEGKSTLGIPKKVGAEFVAADKGGKLPTYKKSEEKSERKKDNERGETRYAPLKNMHRGGY